MSNERTDDTKQVRWASDREVAVAVLLETLGQLARGEHPNTRRVIDGLTLVDALADCAQAVSAPLIFPGEGGEVVACVGAAVTVALGRGATPEQVRWALEGAASRLERESRAKVTEERAQRRREREARLRAERVAKGGGR